MVTIQELAEKTDINLFLKTVFFSFNYELDKPKDNWTSGEKERLKEDAKKYLPYTVRDESKRTSSFSKKGISIFLVNIKGTWGLIVANEGFDKPMVEKETQHPNSPFDIDLRLRFKIHKRIYAYISSNTEEEYKKEINKYYTPLFTNEILTISDTKKFHPGHKMERAELFKSTTKKRPIDPQNSGLYAIFWLVHLLKKAQTEDLGEGALDDCTITPPMLDELRKRIKKAKADNQNITWTWWEKFEVWDDREFEHLLTPADIQFLLERDLEELTTRTDLELAKEKEEKDKQDREKKEREEREKRELEKQRRDKEEKERKELERQRKDREERDKREQTRKDQERLAEEQREHERKRMREREEDKRSKEEAARLESERGEQERLEREKQEQKEREKRESWTFKEPPAKHVDLPSASKPTPPPPKPNTKQSDAREREERQKEEDFKELTTITFAPNKWLNDLEVDWAYRKIEEEVNNKHGYISVYEFPLFINNSDIMSSSRMFIKMAEIDKELVFIPVNNPNVHWSLIVYSTKENKFYHFDSSRKKLNDEDERKGYIRPFTNHFCEHKNASFEDVDKCPLQPNANDCGVYLLTFTKLLSENPSLLKTGIPEIDSERERTYWRDKYKGEEEPNKSKTDKLKEEIEGLTANIDKFFNFIVGYDIENKFGEVKGLVEAIIPRKFSWMIGWEGRDLDLMNPLTVKRWERIRDEKNKGGGKDEVKWLEDKASRLQAFEAKLTELKLLDDNENCSKAICEKLENNERALDTFIGSLKNNVKFRPEHIQECIITLREEYGIHVTDDELPKSLVKRVLQRGVIDRILEERPTTDNLTKLLNYLDNWFGKIKRIPFNSSEQFHIELSGTEQGKRQIFTLAEVFIFKIKREVYSAICDEVFKNRPTHYKIMQKVAEIRGWLKLHVDYSKHPDAFDRELGDLISQTWQNFYFRLQIESYNNNTYLFFDNKTVDDYKRGSDDPDFDLLNIPKHIEELILADEIDEDKKYPPNTRFLNYWPAVFAEIPNDRRNLMKGETTLPPLQDNLCWGEPILFYENDKKYKEFSNFYKLKQPIEISNEELRKRLEVPEPKPKTPPITYNEPPIGGTEEPSTSEPSGERERERET